MSVCGVCVDVMKMLEEERKQFGDLESRVAFTEDIRSAMEVRRGLGGGENVWSGVDGGDSCWKVDLK